MLALQVWTWLDAADHSNGSATRNEPISHARLSSFRPEPGQIAGTRDFGA